MAGQVTCWLSPFNADDHKAKVGFLQKFVNSWPLRFWLLNCKPQAMCEKKYGGVYGIYQVTSSHAGSAVLRNARAWPKGHVLRTCGDQRKQKKPLSHIRRALRGHVHGLIGTALGKKIRCWQELYSLQALRYEPWYTEHQWTATDTSNE